MQRQVAPVAAAAPESDASRRCAAAVLVLEAQAARCASLRRQLNAAMAAKTARGEDIEE